VTGFIFDAGGLIALDKSDRRVLTLVLRAKDRGDRITIPATALAQVIRYPARQAQLSRLLGMSYTDLVPLDGPDAAAVGLLLARTRTADIVDAHVVLCAQRTGQGVVTSDPEDLSRLDPGLRLLKV
jgi:predicted nucleic acid-binding protein